MATTTETKIIEIKVPIGEGIQQIKLLTAEIEKLSAGQAALKKGSEKEKTQYEQNAIAIKEYTRQKNVLKREVQTEIKSTQSAMGSYDKLQTAYTKAQAKAKDLAASNTATAKEISKAAKEANALNDRLKSIDKTVGQSQRGVAEYERGLGGLSKRFMGFIGATAIVAGLGTALRNALGVITEFDQQMANVSAITMATKEEMKQLRDIAIQYGTSTKFTASEVAGLEVELGKLGYTTQQIIDATGGVTLAAAATGESLQKTAEIVGSVTMAFGLSAGESKRVADVMTQSFNATALGLDNFSESIKYVAPVAKQVGVSVEETAALLGVLANSGIKGSMAGTALRRIFSELTKDGGTLQEKLQKLAKEGLNLAGAEDEVGVHAKTALLVLKDQNELIPKLTKEFQNSAGASEIAAAKMMDTISGKTNFLKSTWESFILSVENGDGKFARFLKNMLDKAANAVSGLQRLTMSDADIAKYDAQNSAQSRLKDFEKRAQSEKDYIKYLNEEIVAEKNIYKSKQEKIVVLGEEIKKENEKSFLLKSSTGIKAREDEINGLQKSINKSIEYVNTLGNLRRAKEDATALDLKNQYIVDKNNMLSEDDKDDKDDKNNKKKHDDSLAKLKKERIEEYKLNAKLDKQFEKMKNDARALIDDTDIFQAQFNKKNKGKDPVKDSEEKRAKMLQDSIDAYDNQLNEAQFNADETLRLTQLQLSDQMNLELSAVAEGSQEEFNIRERYRQLNEEADKQATQTKIENVFKWANASADVLQGAFSFADALAENELQLWAEQNKGKANFDEEYAKKKAKIDHQQAVRNKAMQVVNTIINGAASVIAMLGMGAPGIPLAIAAGIAAALQVATIIATPIPSPSDTGGGGGGAKAPALPPDMTSKMANPLSGSVGAIQGSGGSNAITSGAANVSMAKANEPAIYAPKVELSLVELKRAQNQVDFIDNVSTLKS
jgi:uncharacterized coiled-coil protein SlyX